MAQYEHARLILFLKSERKFHSNKRRPLNSNLAGFDMILTFVVGVIPLLFFPSLCLKNENLRNHPLSIERNMQFALYYPFHMHRNLEFKGWLSAIAA
jgi:hypothetical protein